MFLQIRNSVETMSAIVDRLSEFLPPALDTSIKSQNTSSSPYMDSNNLYQGLIQTKTVIILIKIN